jgi:hypothetical protein
VNKRSSSRSVPPLYRGLRRDIDNRMVNAVAKLRQHGSPGHPHGSPGEVRHRHLIANEQRFGNPHKECCPGEANLAGLGCLYERIAATAN